MSDKCSTKKDSFCFVCAKYFTKHQRRHFRGHKIDLYRMYFGIEPQNLGKPFAPRFICTTCSTSFYTWKNHNRHFTFGRPAIWKPIGSDHTDCYFCLTKTNGINKTTKKSLDYPSVRSHLEAPLLHSINVPFPRPYADQIKSPKVNVNDLANKLSNGNCLLNLLLKTEDDEVEEIGFKASNNFNDFTNLKNFNNQKDFDSLIGSNTSVSYLNGLNNLQDYNNLNNLYPLASSIVPSCSQMNPNESIANLNPLLNLTKPRTRSTREVFDLNGALDLTMKSSRN